MITLEFLKWLFQPPNYKLFVYKYIPEAFEHQFLAERKDGQIKTRAWKGPQEDAHSFHVTAREFIRDWINEPWYKEQEDFHNLVP